jgi:hypothetical protein
VPFLQPAEEENERRIRTEQISETKFLFSGFTEEQAQDNNESYCHDHTIVIFPLSIGADKTNQDFIRKSVSKVCTPVCLDDPFSFENQQPSTSSAAAQRELLLSEFYALVKNICA